MIAVGGFFLAATLWLICVGARINTRIEEDRAERDYALVESWLEGLHASAATA